MRLSPRAVTVIIVAIGALLVGYTLYTMNIVPGDVTSGVPTSFSVNGRAYRFTYVATTQAERESGLMNAKVTGATTMLFAFPSLGAWQFWMYDTNTSLDMIWVNAAGGSGRVVYLVAGAQPCLVPSYDSGSCRVYSPTSNANYVIEAMAGFAAANNITVGTSIRFGYGT